MNGFQLPNGSSRQEFLTALVRLGASYGRWTEFPGLDSIQEHRQADGTLEGGVFDLYLDDGPQRIKADDLMRIGTLLGLEPTFIQDCPPKMLLDVLISWWNHYVDQADSPSIFFRTITGDDGDNSVQFSLCPPDPTTVSRVFELAFEALDEHFQGTDMDLDHLDEAYVDAEMPFAVIRLPDKSAEPRVGDVVNGSIIVAVTVDENGELSLEIDVNLKRVWCSNGATHAERKTIKIGDLVGCPPHEHAQLKEEIKRRLADVVGRSTGYLNNLSQMTRNLVGRTVEVATGPDRWFEVVAREFDLDCHVVRLIRSQMLNQSGDSEYDLINAITQAANSLELTPEIRWHLQEVAGEIIARGRYRCPMCLAPLSERIGPEPADQP